MRKFICQVNLVIAGGASVMTLLGLIAAPAHEIFPFALAIIWVVCAVALLKSGNRWAWAGSLLVLATIALQLGADALRLQSMIWQFGYGDHSVPLDPTTVGIPLAAIGFMTACALLFLMVLLSLPAWPSKVRHVDGQNG